jgi:ribonuclease HI
VADKQKAVAYVDGSYHHETGAYAYGVVLFYRGSEYRFAEKCSESELLSMRNVAGEIKGAQTAMQFCLDNQIPALDLYYDYDGIACWCTGLWKATKPGTKAYKKFYHALQGKLKVSFIKVRGHSGDTYNDLADQLAKSALGLA